MRDTLAGLRREHTLRLPRYVWSTPGRSGQRMLYFRIRRGGKTITHRLPDDPTSADFHAEYARHLAALERGKPVERKSGTIGALTAAYLESPEFERLSHKTKGYVRAHLECLRTLREYPAPELSREMVLKLRDKLRDTPRSADQRVAVIRRLYSWGIDRQHVKLNPAERVGKLNVDPGSYEPWSEAERERFERSNPPRHFLTAYMIAAHASPRRGDILRLTAADYDGELLQLKPSKTRRKGVRQLVIPCHSKLREHLDSLKIDVGLLVPGPGGKAWEPSAFSKAFRACLDSIGLTDRHLHGLRHTCAVNLIEAGCSDEEAQAITGHTDSKTLRIYTAHARQAHLARRAIAKLEGKG